MAFGSCHFFRKGDNMKRSLIPKGMGLPLLFVLFWNCLAYQATRLFNRGLYHYNMTLPIDGLIPLIPWTVSIYVLCYLFWVVNYILGTRRGRELGFRLLSAEFLSKAVCLILFMLVPTICVRPELQGGGLWNGILGLIYFVDTPDNLFPSIHCITSWFCYIAVRGDKTLPKWYRVFSLVFALAVCVSTLTTKQHLFVDAPTGVILAELCYYLTEKTGFRRLFQSLFESKSSKT